MESFVHNYPILTLSYLEEEYFREEASNKTDKDKYYLSSKFFKARSFVSFCSDFMEMNDLDRELVSRYSLFLNNSDMTNLYEKKAFVKSEGKQYTVYIQKNLEPYIKNGLTCLLACGIIGLNEELYLISVEFEELAK